MKRSSMVLLCILTVGFVFLLSGCNSIGTGTVNTVLSSGSGSLGPGDSIAQDGSYLNDVTFTPPRSGYVTIIMNSTSIDPYLLVYLGSNDTNQLGSDDDNGPGTNAVFTFYVQSGVTYMARFTTSGPGAKPGNYTYSIAFSDRSISSADKNDSPVKIPFDDSTKLKSVQ